MRWDWEYRGPDAPEPHRPVIVTDGHFRVFFRALGDALDYMDFQNAKEEA